MAVYRNKNDDTIFYDGEFKLKVSMDTIDGYDMSDDGNEFSCTFSTGNGDYTLTKSQMIPVEDNPTTYIAPLDSTILGKGTLTVHIVKLGATMRRDGIERNHTSFTYYVPET